VKERGLHVARLQSQRHGDRPHHIHGHAHPVGRIFPRVSEVAEAEFLEQAAPRSSIGNEESENEGGLSGERAREAWELDLLRLSDVVELDFGRAEGRQVQGCNGHSERRRRDEKSHVVGSHGVRLRQSVAPPSGAGAMRGRLIW
jgi:hypothetical protein